VRYQSAIVLTGGDLCHDQAHTRQSRSRAGISGQALHWNVRANVAFDAHLDETGISLSLHRTGAADIRKSVRMHFHYGLFADILHDLAKTVSSVPPADAAHRDALREAAKDLYQALNPRRNDKDDIAQMTPEEEVLLLHVME
jgi:hypothetical protein